MWIKPANRLQVIIGVYAYRANSKVCQTKEEEKNVIGDQFTVRNLIMKINHNISAHIWNYHRENVNVYTCV